MATNNVAFIGLGTMGRPMAEQLLKHRVELRVFDVAQDATKCFAEKGVVVASSLSELSTWADIVILMLPSPQIVRETVIGSNGAIHALRRGSVVIDMSTTGPGVVQECGRELEKRGIELIDAPVGKGPAAAWKGDLTILMGGKSELCRSLEWVLKPIGSEIHYCGPLGAGQAVKLVNNMVSCSNAAILAEAFALARVAGADLDVLKDVMAGTAADSWQLRNTVIAKALKRDFSPGFKLALARKDLHLAVAMADELEARSSCARGAISWYDDAAASGYGDLDRAALMLLADPRLKQS